MKKILVLGVILLFIGVAVAPSINQSIAKASTDDDLVEVTTQACGIQGYGNSTVKLTREQYQEYQLSMVAFRSRLNNTDSREEALPIFKEIIVELEKYNLLPEGMSIKKAEELLLPLIAHKQMEKKYPFLIGIKNSNYFSLVIGHVLEGNPQGTLPSIVSTFFGKAYIHKNSEKMRFLWDLSSKLLTFQMFFKFIHFFSLLPMGHSPWNLNNTYYTWGTVISIGLLGLKIFYGHLLGNCFTILIDDYLAGVRPVYRFIGGCGFMGLSISYFSPGLEHWSDFFGTVLWVKIDSKPL